MRTSPSSCRPRSVLLVFPYGFGAAEGGFKGMKPWEEEHERKNERERSCHLGGGEREGGRKWAVGPPPSKQPFSSSFFSLFFLVLLVLLRWIFGLFIF